MDLGALNGAENSDKSIAQIPPAFSPTSRARVWVRRLTGGRPAPLWVELGEGAGYLKGRVASELRLPSTTSFHLLLGDRQLERGSLMECGVRNGSIVTVVPLVQSGLKASRSKAENSLHQALESLTDTQLSDFLCGRSPLTLTLTLAGTVSHFHLQLTPRRSTPSSAHPTLTPRRSPGTAGQGVMGEEEGNSSNTMSFSRPRIECLHQLGSGSFSGIFSGSLPPPVREEGKRRGGGVRRRREELALVQRILREVLTASRSAPSALTPSVTPGGHVLTGGRGAREEAHGIVGGYPTPQDDRPTPPVCSLTRPASLVACPAYPEAEEAVTRRKLKSLQLLIRQRREKRGGRGLHRLRPPPSSHRQSSLSGSLT